MLASWENTTVTRVEKLNILSHFTRSNRSWEGEAPAESQIRESTICHAAQQALRPPLCRPLRRILETGTKFTGPHFDALLISEDNEPARQ